ncbi:hypothetical protein [Sulfurimonas sp. CS5]|uniref:hypothetical protein n=1 Tax=Sulfurimonas sp. CS5 TaxID=3391145 RepID=UPI0039EB59D6
MLKLIAGVMSIFFGYMIFNSGEYPVYYGYKIELGIFKIPTSILFFSIGIYIMLLKENRIKYSKCPKCKTSYRYETLKDGICPVCNIKTIETEEYYKKYPEELDNI